MEMQACLKGFRRSMAEDARWRRAAGARTPNIPLRNKWRCEARMLISAGHGAAIWFDGPQAERIIRCARITLGQEKA